MPAGERATPGAGELETLLVVLRGERLSIGVAEEIRLRHVLRLGPCVDRAGMAQLVACLVARSAEEREACGRAVQLWFASEEPKLAREARLESAERSLGAGDDDPGVHEKGPVPEHADEDRRAGPAASDVGAAARSPAEADQARTRRERLFVIGGVASGIASLGLLAALGWLGVSPGGDAGVLPRLLAFALGAGAAGGLVGTVARRKWLPEPGAVADRKASLDLPALPVLLRKPALLSDRDQQDVVDGLGSFTTEWLTTELDTRATTVATARRAGLPALRFRSHREVRTVWLWIDASARDPLLDRTAFEVHATLRAGGIPVEVALFHAVPSLTALYRATFSEDGDLRGPHPRIPPAELGEDGDSIVAVVLTDGRELSIAARGSRAKLAHRALRALGRYSKLALVDFGREPTDLPLLAEKHRLRRIPPEELTTFLAGEVPQRENDFLPGTRLRGNVAVWAAACALSPRPVDEATALALRDHLVRHAGLRVPSWAIRSLLAASAVPGAIAFRQATRRGADGEERAGTGTDTEDRARLLAWLWMSEVDGLQETGTLRTALRFWEEHHEDNPIDRALLRLWQMPGQTPDRLEEAVKTLWDWKKTRPGERASAEVQAHAPHPEGPGPLADPEGYIVLPWRRSEVPPETWLKLQELGIGHLGEPPAVARARMPGTVALGVALAGGVGFSALLGMSGSVPGLLIGIGVLPVVVYLVARRFRGAGPAVVEVAPVVGHGAERPGRVNDAASERGAMAAQPLIAALPPERVPEPSRPSAGDPPDPVLAPEPLPQPLETITESVSDEASTGVRIATAERIGSADRPTALDMVALPGGTFLMGSRDDDPEADPSEKPRHQVKVSAFAIGRFTVTQADYAAVMGEHRGEPVGDELPVNRVSWFDAVTFCNRLSVREGLHPTYVVEGKEVTWNPEADGYRLPTEAEWEYAARAWMATAWSFGNDEAQLGEHAWYKASAGGRVQPVGKKKPNPFGLHDMHGNVWEWCWDWFGTYVTSNTASVNPIGRPAGDDRVLRGGSWSNGPRGLRSACRYWRGPSFRVTNIGFRCVRGVVRQHGR